MLKHSCRHFLAASVDCLLDQTGTQTLLSMGQCKGNPNLVSGGYFIQDGYTRPNLLDMMLKPAKASEYKEGLEVSCCST